MNYVHVNAVVSQSDLVLKEVNGTVSNYFREYQI